jgi:hypothetical protein
LAKRKRKKLNPPGTTMTAFGAGGAAAFGADHVLDSTFSVLAQSPLGWLRLAASLLRAAYAIKRQMNADSTAISRAATRRGRMTHRASTTWQMAMLASMACEDALKALILARRPIVQAGVERTALPDELRSHDLEELAALAELAAATAEERDVLAAGRNFIEYAGRYPTALKAEIQPSGAMVAPNVMLPACRNILMRCVEETTRATFEESEKYRTAASLCRQVRAQFNVLLGAAPPDVRRERKR